MKLTKQKSKYLMLCILVCLCGSVLIGMYLLNAAHKLNLYAGPGQNRSVVFKAGDFDIQMHPNGVLPAFIHKQLTTLNSTAKNYLPLELGIKNLTYAVESVTDHSNRLVPSKFAEYTNEILHLGEVTGPPCYETHAFYYPWYGSPEYDGQYLHWNHPYIRHWNPLEAKKWPNYTHKPPDDVGSNFYPLLGAYSSRDESVIDMHMQMMRFARIGVLVVSWYPPGDADNEGREPDSVLPLHLHVADKYGLKVALHIEPYKNRNHATLKENLHYIIQKYGQHPAFYRTGFRDKRNLPVIYLYDSYLVDSSDWKKIFSPHSNITVRNTDLDAIFIGLLVENKHKDHIVNSGFDGFYTYFATNQFTYGSTWKEWPFLAKFAESKGLMFIPSVGPGYIDTEVRPWNSANTRRRLDGKYYNEAFSSATGVKPGIVSITSFNEWHEGTQIEPAVRKKTTKRTYLDYSPNSPNFYLDLTRKWVERFTSKSHS